LCQTYTTYVAANGDSGAPVFRRVFWNGLRHRRNVHLLGIHWGSGVNSDGSTYAVYSPIWNIQAELGPLTIF
jgi:hypothetical protein